MKLNRVLKYIGFLLLVGLLGFLYSFSLKRNMSRIVKKVEVEFLAGDNNFLTHSMVNKLLIQNDTSVKNQAKSVIDLYKLEKTVSKNSYVENAAVFLTIDGTLKSIVKQRVPIARITGEKVRIILINRE